ncbi:MAG: glycosyltransferase [Chloroflexota bacterium]|nr:glycosyltransferase [Chloroflexota bacterium]
MFSVAGGSGHLHPLMPLASALRQAGHDVAFAVSVSLRRTVEASGFPVFQVGGKLAADPEYQQFRAERSAMPVGLATELLVYPRLFVGMGARMRTPELVAICKAWLPDMLIRETGEYGAVVAAERLGLPHAAVSFAASLKALMIFEREAATFLDPVRQLWGLPADPAFAAPYRYLLLNYAPPAFSTHDVGGQGLGLRSYVPTSATASIPATTHFIRPEIFDNAGDERLPDWMAGLPDQPTVYATLGTEVNSEPDLYPSVLQTIIEGLRDLPVNLIVTLGRDKEPADFGPQPANVHIERYIPQSLLLGLCDLTVMHGGSNSLLAAVDAGLPMVLVPLIADQFFNAQAAESLGLAQVVQREQLTAVSIRSAVEKVASDPAYRQRVAQMRADMQVLPDQSHAVELVERVAYGDIPVLPTGWPYR